MNSDRDDIRAGGAAPDEDRSDADLTGEFTIDYTPPAWYTENDSSSGAGAPAVQAPPTGPPMPVTGPAGPVGAPSWTASAEQQGQHGQPPADGGGYGYPQGGAPGQTAPQQPSAAPV
ncbi:topoisomerase II, partial [Streptomyces sp. DJ]